MMLWESMHNVAVAPLMEKTDVKGVEKPIKITPEMYPKLAIESTGANGSNAVFE